MQRRLSPREFLYRNDGMKVVLDFENEYFDVLEIVNEK